MKADKYTVLRDRWFMTRRRCHRLMLTQNDYCGSVDCWDFFFRRTWDGTRMLHAFGQLRLAFHLFSIAGCTMLTEADVTEMFERHCADLRCDNRDFVETADMPIAYPYRQLKRAYNDWLEWRNRLFELGQRDAMKLNFHASMMPGAGNVRAWGWYGCRRPDGSRIPPAETSDWMRPFDEMICANTGRAFDCTGDAVASSKER